MAEFSIRKQSFLEVKMYYFGVQVVMQHCLVQCMLKISLFLTKLIQVQVNIVQVYSKMFNIKFKDNTNLQVAIELI